MFKNTKPPAPVAGRRSVAASPARDTEATTPEAADFPVPDAASGPPKVRQDPAVVAAVLMLERAMAAAGLTLEGGRAKGTVVLLTAPTPEWVEPACGAWEHLVAGDGHMENADVVRGWRFDINAVICFRRAAPPTKAQMKDGNAEFGEFLWKGHPLVGVAADVGWLPSDLVAAADHRLAPVPLDGAGLSEAAGLLTDAPANVELTRAEAAGVTPRLLRLAFRPEQTADGYLRKLSELLAAERKAAPTTAVRRGSPREEPRLARLAGMDQAVEWGMVLARDIADCKAGTLVWADVDRGCC